MLIPLKNSKLYFNIHYKDKTLLSKKPKLKKFINDVNESWSDIVYLNYILDLILDVNKGVNPNNIHFTFRIEAMTVLCKCFYIHIDIIKKLIEKSPKELELEYFYRQYNKFWGKIRIARNNLFIHKEKEKVYYPIFQSTTSINLSGSLKTLSMRISGKEMPLPKSNKTDFSFTVKYLDNNNKEAIIELCPKDDCRIILSILKNLEKLINENC